MNGDALAFFIILILFVFLYINNKNNKNNEGDGEEVNPPDVIEDDLVNLSKRELIKNIKRNLRAYEATQILCSRFDINGDVKATLIWSLENSSSQVQIEAAQYLGKIGMKHLLKIFPYGLDTVEDLIWIIEVFIENNYKKALPLLKEIYSQIEYNALKVLILNAFRQIGSKKYSIFIGKLLSIEYETVVLIAALDALKEIGNKNSIENIYALENKSEERVVQKKCKNTRLAIQDRLNLTGRGNLSLSEHNSLAGNLSMDLSKKGMLSKLKKK